MLLENQTPFAAERLAVKDPKGADALLVIVKGSFEISARGALAAAATPAPVELADRYYGDPAKTSVKYASDFSIGKVSTDVVVVGHARSGNGRVPQVDVGVRAGAVQKSARVFGDRHWISTLGVKGISRPEPFEEIPLVYELAFGGEDQQEYEVRNPAGTGFRAKKSNLPVEGTKLPNIEDPAALITGPNDRPQPAGFGFIGPAWQPRLSYAGTYDEKWMKTRKPLLPVDFDPRFFNVAQPGLTATQFLAGTEKVTLVGVTRPSPFSFLLPGIQPQCRVLVHGAGEVPVELHLDRVVIDADAMSLILLWSGLMAVKGAYHEVDAVVCTVKP